MSDRVSMADKVPFVTFNNGQKYPMIGLGTWKSKPEEVTQAVKDAIDAGYRHIDCAYAYGNEKDVGVGIKEKIDEGIVTRKDLYITSKLWNTFHRPDLVIPALKQCLDDLGLEYLDLYLMHWPMGFKEGDEMTPEDPETGKTLYSDVDYVDTWKAMEEAVEQGLTKSIGVSNFNVQQVDRILEICKIKPVTNQIESHPYLTQEELQNEMRKRDIVITGYSPLGSPDRPWRSEGDLKIMNDAIINDVAVKHKKTSPQVMIKFQIQRGNITIPKSVHKDRIYSNINIFDFELDEDDMKRLSSLNVKARCCGLEWVRDHKYFPFVGEYDWMDEPIAKEGEPSGNPETEENK